MSGQEKIDLNKKKRIHTLGTNVIDSCTYNLAKNIKKKGVWP